MQFFHSNGSHRGSLLALSTVKVKRLLGLRRGTWLGAGLMALGAPATLGCYDGADDEASEERKGGVNGPLCYRSPYNCKMRVPGWVRVATADEHDTDEWKIAVGAPIRDGNGTLLANSTRDRARYNYGQQRKLAGEPHAFSQITSNGSAGWIPLASLVDRALFEAALGNVTARGAGLKKMACYAIRNWHDPVLELLKVVEDSEKKGPDGHERAGDYLPIVRNNGMRSANLIFNIPGQGYGSPSIDHFPAGTKFQRVAVTMFAPDDNPSIDVPLWDLDDNGDYLKPAGVLKFVYGYIFSTTGDKRYGWMAIDALEPSSGCDKAVADPQDVPDDQPGSDDSGDTVPPPDDSGDQEPEPPPPNKCMVRCCDESLQGPADTASPDACHEASKAMCEAHDLVKRSEWNGQEVYKRADQCWAKCKERKDYHKVEVDKDCLQHATKWCNEGTRGGLQDALWDPCDPN